MLIAKPVPSKALCCLQKQQLDRDFSSSELEKIDKLEAVILVFDAPGMVS